MIRYLNVKLYGITETVDHLDSRDFKSIREFKQEKQRVLSEYRTAFKDGDPYWSQRKCK